MVSGRARQNLELGRMRGIRKQGRRDVVVRERKFWVISKDRKERKGNRRRGFFT